MTAVGGAAPIAFPAPGEPLRVEQLRVVRMLADQPDAVLDWIAERCEVVHLAAGEVLNRPGDPAEWKFLMLTGELRTRRDTLGSAAPIFVTRAGDTSRVLPFSRMTTWPGTTRASSASVVARFPLTAFDELLHLSPALEPRFVALLTDRVRDVTWRDQQFEKLHALGRLAAGLAHESNNPAAAAARAIAGLRERMQAVAPLAHRQLLEEAGQSTARISDMVRAIKAYSYTDTTTSRAADVHEGIEQSLTMLTPKLRDARARIVRD